ncbi:MAG: hypothetical protein DRI34_12985 [Deltaproteobacteria bacterium]|nr:MAG: hypothetical protein DRI34_12985 [Deltaproteobacteria bacterium]
MNSIMTPAVDDERMNGLRQLATRFGASQLVSATCLARSQAAARRAGPGPLSTGLGPLDELTGGGLVPGCLNEIVVGHGGAVVTQSLLASATGAGRFAALVDAGDGLDVDSAAASGVALEKLLWVRAADHVQALRCTETILEADGFALLVLDLAGPAGVGAGRCLPASAWVRLQRLSRASRSVVVLLSARPLAGPLAALTVRLRRVRSRWADSAAGDSWLEGLEPEFERIR